MFVQARNGNSEIYKAVAVSKRARSPEFSNGCSVAGNQNDVQWSPEGGQKNRPAEQTVTSSQGVYVKQTYVYTAGCFEMSFFQAYTLFSVLK